MQNEIDRTHRFLESFLPAAQDALQSWEESEPGHTIRYIEEKRSQGRSIPRAVSEAVDLEGRMLEGIFLLTKPLFPPDHLADHSFIYWYGFAPAFIGIAEDTLSGMNTTEEMAENIYKHYGLRAPDASVAQLHIWIERAVQLLVEDRTGMKLVDNIANSQEDMQRRRTRPFGEFANQIVQFGASRYKKLYNEFTKSQDVTDQTSP